MKGSCPIYLYSGVVITLENGRITCKDDDDTIISLTAGQQKLLKKLAENLNRLVSFDELYAAYATEDQQLTYVGNVNSNIAKMKRTFPNCIRTSIKNTRNLGYTLEGATSPLSAQGEQQENASPIAELAGDYYGFYLDPLGSGTLLNAYLHIDTPKRLPSSQLKAYMILGIRNQQVLLNEELANIFINDVPNYKDRFLNFRDTLSKNDKRCSWSEGSVIYEDQLAIMNLNLNHGKWEVLIDLENYLKGNRKRTDENDYYRGGLGLVLGTRTLHGTYALRFGLVRKAFLKDAFLSDAQKTHEMLKIMDGSRNAEWKPLKLSGWLDRCWYDLMMDC